MANHLTFTNAWTRECPAVSKGSMSPTNCDIFIRMQLYNLRTDTHV